MLFKTKLCSLPTPHTKFCLNKNIPNYDRFHVNCYLKATCNFYYSEKASKRFLFLYFVCASLKNLFYFLLDVVNENMYVLYFVVHAVYNILGLLLLMQVSECKFAYFYLLVFHIVLTEIKQKGMHLNHDFYVIVGKQCRTGNALYTGQ